MSETKINAALVSAYLACNLYPLKGTSWEGDEFTPVVGSAYARFTDLPSSRAPAAQGQSAPQERTGILQIDLYHPKGTGTGPILADADKALTFFRSGKHLDYLGQDVLIRRSERSALRTEAAWQSMAIEVYYTAWVFPS